MKNDATMRATLIPKPVTQKPITAVSTVTNNGAGNQTPIEPAAVNTVENTESVEDNQLGTVITGSADRTREEGPLQYSSAK